MKLYITIITIIYNFIFNVQSIKQFLKYILILFYVLIVIFDVT